jgi:hypothetical protein
MKPPLFGPTIGAKMLVNLGACIEAIPAGQQARTNGEGFTVSRYAGKRTGAKVRRNSYRRGNPFAFKRMTRSEAWEIYNAAYRYNQMHKAKGDHMGPLGNVGLEVLRLFVTLLDPKSGRLEPSYDFICRTLSRSRDSVSKAIRALELHGFITKQRRFVETEISGKGPQVRQITNAYSLGLPAAVAKAFTWLREHLPLPDDFTHARTVAERELKAYERSLEPDEYARHIVEDEGLAASLAALGKAIMAKRQRESGKQTESYNPLFI